MNDLLDADCTINHLLQLNIIVYRNWKTQAGQDIKIDYFIFFNNPDNNCDIGLQIIKRANNYFVPRSIIKILAVRHRFDPTDIFTECEV